jgi:galactose mutarotase-like enzyme
MDTIVIENEALQVAVIPGYGGRVISLFDKASTREWLAQGGQSPNIGEDARYLAAEAFGWDECFPTVAPWDASGTAWRRPLRDHGDLWGRPWQVDFATAEAIALSYADGQFSFSRELRLDGAAVIARYSVENLSGEPLPYLWALHGLLAATPEDRIVLPGVDKVSASYLALGGARLTASELAWPAPGDTLPFPLDRVQPASTAFAGKLYASGVAGGSALVGHPGQWLEIDWDTSIEHLGVWLTYGGWPAPGGSYQIALEPTTSAADHLGQAIDAGFLSLAPGERRDWRVTFTLKSEHWT